MKPVLFVTALLALTACDAGAADRSRSVQGADARAAEAPHAPALITAGDALPVEADSTQDLQSSAAVVRVDHLANQGLQPTVKLFGTAGGDPAMNGLYTYVAVFAGAAEGWRVFQLGDFVDYRVLADAPGRIDLEVTESVLNPATDEISSRTRRVIVTWTPAGPDGAPETISVAPAR